MNQTTTSTFWERLAARTKPTEALRTVERPMAIVRVFTGATLVSFIQAVAFALVFVFFGETTAAWATLSVGIAFLVTWIVYAVTGNVLAAALITLTAGFASNIVVHVSLGGYANSGAFWFWGIAMTVIVALLMGPRAAAATGLFYALVGIVFAFFEQSLAASRAAPDPTLTSILFVIVLIGSLNMTAPLVLYIMRRLASERERAEWLLLNVLPAEVAGELKETGATPARRFASISVLFADIVGFTPLTAEMEPEEIVDRLNEVFTYFDTLADEYGCEKIRTIGDAYMVAAGIPAPREDHAQALCGMALDMLEYANTGPLSFRLGINSGPAVAGVIGTHKFQYDVWGDTVNTASRMESHAEVGRIQISEATHDLIDDDFATIPRGPVEIKGKGTLNTWYLTGVRNRAAASTA